MKLACGLMGMLVAVIGIGLVASAADDDASDACPSEVTKWLSQCAISLETTDPTVSLEDLEPLRAIIGDARIVGLGEQTHGTSQFSEMKHRIFRFLVEEMGFRLLAFEADWFSVRELNSCLRPGGQAIESAFSSLGYRVWQTNEVMALLHWIRGFNEANPDDRPVQLVGADILMGVGGVAALAVDFLRQVDRSAFARFRSVLESDLIDAWDYLREVFYYGASDAPPSPGRVEECLGVLDPVMAWLEANEDLCVAGSSRPEYGLCVRALELASAELARIALLGEGVIPELDSRFTLERDRIMAENVAWWLAHLEEPKIAVWAHNGHIARQLSSMEVFIPMGQHLGDVFGDEYLAIGFSFAEGTLTAWDGRSRDPRTFVAEALIAGCYEACFETTGIPLFAADLRDLDLGSASHAWMTAERGFRMISSYYGPDDLGWEYPIVLPASYDVIVHVQTSTPALQWAP